MKPFLKWAGNKYKTLKHIKKILPEGNRLIEPFTGSAALFLNTDYSNYLLNDSNHDLIETYRHLQREGDTFIQYCKQFFISENNLANRYYEFRELFNSTDNLRFKVALFIYLNKHCFNGLCRYNKQGKFNTPFGKYVRPYFPEKEMVYFYQHAQRAHFTHSNFENILQQAKPGDVVYCDPPYVPLSKTANFTHYNMGGFTLLQQRELAFIAETLANKGIPVLISNHCTEFILELYKNAEIHTYEAQRHISCDGKNRRKVKEVLALFG